MIFMISGGGGLSTNDALLHINAPTGSTITLKKNSVTVATLAANQGHANIDGVTADWYYSVSSANYGTWAVTATKSGETATENVAINSNKQYDVTIEYKLYIFKSGTGLNSSYTVNQTRSGSSYYIDTTSFGATSVSSGAMFYFTPKVDITKYTKLRVDQICYAQYSSTYKLYVGIGNNYSGSVDESPTDDIARSVQYNTTRTTYDINLSNVTNGQYYVKVQGGAVKFSIYNLWFE